MLAPDHPQIPLAFYIEGPSSDADAEAIQTLIDELKFKRSRDRKLVFIFEFNGDYTGEIDNGAPDDYLTEAFVGEWERNLI